MHEANNENKVIQFDPISIIFLVKMVPYLFMHEILQTIYISPKSSEHAQSDGVNSYYIFSSLTSILAP